jgi:hypothetical protein
VVGTEFVFSETWLLARRKTTNHLKEIIQKYNCFGISKRILFIRNNFLRRIEIHVRIATRLPADFMRLSVLRYKRRSPPSLLLLISR